MTSEAFLDDLLQRRVAAEQASSSPSDPVLPPPCDAAEVAKLSENARNVLSLDLPEPYRSFLVRVDGLRIENARVYGSVERLSHTPQSRAALPGWPPAKTEGIIEKNLELRQFRELDPNLLVVAFDEESYHAWNERLQRYDVLDRYDCTPFDHLDTFEDVLRSVYQPLYEEDDSDDLL
jgi:hypothetical protein